MGKIMKISTTAMLIIVLAIIMFILLFKGFAVCMDCEWQYDEVHGTWNNVCQSSDIGFWQALNAGISGVCV